MTMSYSAGDRLTTIFYSAISKEIGTYSKCEQRINHNNNRYKYLMFTCITGEMLTSSTRKFTSKGVPLLLVLTYTFC